MTKCESTPEPAADSEVAKEPATEPEPATQAKTKCTIFKHYVKNV